MRKCKSCLIVIGTSNASLKCIHHCIVFIGRDALQTARNTISQHVSAAFQCYEKNTDTLDVACCVTRSAVCPSIADMLEWLQDADRHYRFQYPLKPFWYRLFIDDVNVINYLCVLHS